MGNLIAMPIISIVVMPAGLLAMLLMPFGLDHYPLLAMGMGIEWMIQTATVVSNWGGEITTGRIPQTAFVLIGIGSIAAVCCGHGWRLPGLASSPSRLCLHSLQSLSPKMAGWLG